MVHIQREPEPLGADMMDQSWVEMVLFTRPQRSLGHLGMISLNCGACANVRLEVAGEMTTSQIDAEKLHSNVVNCVLAL